MLRRYLLCHIFSPFLHILEMASSRSTQKFGVSFSPAGLLTPFHLGAARALGDYGVIRDTTSLAGSSGGALAAVTAALKLDSKKAFYACEKIARECREKGTRLTLRLALDDQLDKLLPSDAAELLNKRSGKTYLAYTDCSTFPPIGTVCSDFTDRSDLLDILRASCNIPLYFNGNSAFVNVRGINAVDGFFAISRNRFGCPPTYAENEVIVCPFDPVLIGLKPRPLIFSADGSYREPEVMGGWDIISSGLSSGSGGSSAISDTSQYGPSNEDISKGETVQKIDVVSPRLLQPHEWPFSILEIVQMAFGPPSRATYDKLVAHASLHPRVLDTKGTKVEELFSILSKPFTKNRGLSVIDEIVYPSPDPAGHEYRDESIALVYRYLFKSGAVAAMRLMENQEKKIEEKL